MDRYGEIGLNISTKFGVPVRAVASGQVVRTQGNIITIRHNNAYSSVYSNNHSLFVKEGEFVNVGQQISIVGRDDKYNGLLHFELKCYNKSVNPLTYLRN
jgi:murein DD-endopeptidase MepM/ murein hydrolase activator NlpD